MRKSFLFFLLYCLILANDKIYAQTNSWYKWLTGSIDKYPVTMHLHKMGHEYNGYYYYNKTQKPIFFSGSDTTRNIIELYASVNADERVEKFVITVKDSLVSGTWQKDEKSPKLNFFVAEKKDSTTTAFTVVYTRGSVRLKPKLLESPEATYEASAVWTLGNSTKDEFIRTSIRKILGIKDESSVGEFFLKQKKTSFNEYMEEFQDVEDVNLKERPYTYSNDILENLMIMYQSKKFITLGDYSYSYTGGAHGLYGTSYYVLDLINLKELKIEDILNESGRKMLSKILEEQFRMDNNLMSTDSLQEAGLFNNKIDTTDNFYITSSGIGFVYVPYEIGPYSMGEIEIFIPFYNLTEYLTNTIRELIKK